MEADPAAIAPSPLIIAYPARYYRYTRFIMVAALFIYGLMSLRDGFKVYPAENAAARHRGLDALPHPALDVPFNQVLGCVLPPLSLLFLAWTLYNSRGSYRFDGTTLEIPGHPPLPMTALRTVDRTKWDRPKASQRLNTKPPALARSARSSSTTSSTNDRRPTRFSNRSSCSFNRRRLRRRSKRARQ